jgi:glucose dehydrogenase
MRPDTRKRLTTLPESEEKPLRPTGRPHTNDDWDYDGMATPILVDTTIDGKPVKAAVVSNRNGYFYAIDRSNGQFLYAIPLIDNINWTTGFDPKPASRRSTRR